MSAIDLRTEIPGPRSRELWARREASVPRGPASATPVFVEEARGAVLTDVDGNRLLDFAGGIGCLNVGHANEAVLRAAAEQLARLTHGCFHVTPYEAYVTLAERMNRLVPGEFPKKTLFTSTGAEAVENAVKIARAATGRPAILAFEDGFHGRTLLALSLTSKVHPYKAGFGPFAPEIYRVPYGYCYRCSYNLTHPSCALHCVRTLEDVFKRYVEAEKVAAVVVEPVLGEGGFVVPPADYLPRLRELTARHGILLIADEVQTGFGRTGRLFAVEHTGVVPDILIAAKSIAGGLPLSSVTGRAEIMDAPGVGGPGRDLRRQPRLLGRRPRRPRSDGNAARARRGRGPPGRGARGFLEGALRPRGRGAGPGGDVGNRAGEGPPHEGSRQGGDRRGRQGLLRAGPRHDHCRDLRERDPGADAPRHP